MVGLKTNRMVRGIVVHWFEKDKLALVHWKRTTSECKALMAESDLVVIVK
jgi:hypothetical protein